MSKIQGEFNIITKEQVAMECPKYAILIGNAPLPDNYIHVYNPESICLYCKWTREKCPVPSYYGGKHCSKPYFLLDRVIQKT